MPYDPTGSIQDAPDLSPTTLVLNYLKSKGVTRPSNSDVRNALHQNAMNGGTLIPGLINQDPGEDTNTKAPTGGPAVGRGGGSSVADKVEGSKGPNVGSTAPGDRGATPPADRRDGDVKTSAPPGPVDTGFDESRYAPAQPQDTSIGGAIARSVADRNAPQGPVPGDFPPMADPSASFNQDQSQQLGLGGPLGAGATATAALGLPSLANLILGNKGAQTPPVLPVTSQGLASPPPTVSTGPMGPQPAFGPPTVGEAATTGLNVLPPGMVKPPGGPVGPGMIPPDQVPNVPFTARPGGAPRVPPPAASMIDTLKKAAVDAARAGRMFRR